MYHWIISFRALTHLGMSHRGCGPWIFNELSCAFSSNMSWQHNIYQYTVSLVAPIELWGQYRIA